MHIIIYLTKLRELLQEVQRTISLSESFLLRNSTADSKEYFRTKHSLGIHKF